MTDDFWNSAKMSARYTNEKSLGSGGMGSVYLVKDKVLDKLVAIKVLDVSLTPQQSMRFQREGKLSGKLNHENIVSVLDFGISEKNIPYLVMEYLPGKDLRVVLKESGPLELEKALPIFKEICAGMTHSHANGILHRDLKPENIIVIESSQQNSHIKIVDFGIARLKEQDGKLTQSGGIVGSPLYMAPEQSTGVADERSDIYSIGCLMFATLTGQPPFIGENPLEITMKHKSSDPLSMSETAKRSIPAEAEKIVTKCLSKNPADRYQSFSELNEHLTQLELSLHSGTNDEHENEDGVKVVPLSIRGLFLKASKTQRAIIFSCVALFLVVCIATVYVLVSQTGNNTESSTTSKSKNADKEFDIKPATALPKPAKHPQDLFRISSNSGAVNIESYLTEVSDKDLTLLKDYPKINKLILNTSEVTGTGFANWQDRQVKTLYLNDTRVSYDGLEQICKLPDLETLNLIDVKTLTTNHLRLLATKSNISSLFFSREELSEQSLEALSQSKTIRDLGIGDMRISERGIESILAIENLSVLRLMQCQLTDRAFQRLQKQNKLKGVFFSHGSIDSIKMEKILRLPVHSLGFTSVTLEHSVLEKLRGDKRITRLDVSSPDSTAEQLIEIKNSFPRHPHFKVSAQSIKEILDDGESKKPFDFDFLN